MKLKRAEEKIKQILLSNRDIWDHEGYRPEPRREFQKVCKCRTPAMGANVFSSGFEERTEYFTCGSRACSSCGVRATLDWQREKWCSMPDVSYTNVNFTIPGCFRPIFGSDPDLELDLGALAASVLISWAWRHHGVRVQVLSITQTFGSDLKYNPHVHAIVSSGGITSNGREWKPVIFTRDELWALWRYALTSFVSTVHAGRPDIGAGLNLDLDALLPKWSTAPQAWWNFYVSNNRSKYDFLRYAARYVRRLPIMQSRIVRIESRGITLRSWPLTLIACV